MFRTFKIFVVCLLCLVERLVWLPLVILIVDNQRQTKKLGWTNDKYNQYEKFWSNKTTAKDAFLTKEY